MEDYRQAQVSSLPTHSCIESIKGAQTTADLMVQRIGHYSLQGTISLDFFNIWVWTS